MLFDLIGLAITHDDVNKSVALGILGKELLTTDAKTVKSSAQSQRLEGLTVDLAEVDTLDEIKDILVETVLLALINDGLCHTVAHTLDGCQSKAYLSLLVNTELLERLVHIRAQRGYAHLLAFIHQLGDFRNLIATTTHDSCHELSRIIGLEVGCLEGYPRIAGSMRLVEGIGSKRLPVTPYLLQHLGVVAVLLTALNELGLHGVNDVFLFLTHRLTQGVALASGKVGQQT